MTAPITSCEYFDNKHGYDVNRRVEVYKNKVSLPKDWKGIKRFIKVRRWGERDGERFDNTAYYILSREIDSAEVLARAIQEHWCIENNLHWIKDVNLGEDGMTIKTPDLASKLACFNNIVVNLLGQSGYKPTVDTLSYFREKIERLWVLFNK